MRARLRPRFSGFRRRYYGYAEKKRIRRRLRLTALVAAVCLLAVLINARIAPLLRVYAANAARSAMTEAINTAVTKVIDGSEIRYADLIQVQTDSSDNIIAIESDILKINRLKAEVTNAVLEELKSARYHQVSVPLGDLLGGNLLLGARTAHPGTYQRRRLGGNRHGKPVYQRRHQPDQPPDQHDGAACAVFRRAGQRGNGGCPIAVSHCGNGARRQGAGFVHQCHRG